MGLNTCGWLHIPLFFLQVKVGFTVKASSNIGGSIADLSKKNKGSIVSLQKVLICYSFVTLHKLINYRSPGVSAVLS